jgi:hypothetical protein
MLELSQVKDVADQVARATLTDRQLEAVSVRPSVDSFGSDLLRITVVVHGAAGDSPGGAAVEALEGALRDRLDELDDHRLAIVDILTPADLAVDVDSES